VKGFVLEKSVFESSGARVYVCLLVNMYLFFVCVYNISVCMISGDKS